MTYQLVSAGSFKIWLKCNIKAGKAIPYHCYHKNPENITKIYKTKKYI